MKTLRSVLVLVFGLTAVLSSAKFDGPKIQSPRDGATVNGNEVVFSGESEGDTVKVSAYMGRNPSFQQQVQVERGRWRIARPMAAGNYQIKAEDKTGSTVINIRVIGRGTVTPPISGRLNILTPRDGATMNSGNVTFRGSAENNGDVELSVYEGSKRVYNGKLRVRNGSWSAVVNLNDGRHSARVSQGRRSDSVNFNVGRDNGQADRVAIASPRNGQSVRGPRVTVSGTSSARSVGVVLTRGKARIMSSSTKVNNGRWSFGVTLTDGDYHLEVTAGSSKASVDFSVRK
ncbi:MAG: hypothetical protein JSS66_17515 [Armatimonadetes bacterium]|nr:hypothetical protein [Armatimonadota bacterium]